LFATLVRSRAEHGTLPWHTAAISGWIVAKANEKLSKSKGNSTTGPNELIDTYTADAVRYWSACGRPGVDLVLDTAQMKVGRRLATKLLNASRFVLGFAAVDETAAADVLADVVEPLDRAMLARLSTVVESATSAFEDYDHTGALVATETFFWEFCDDYIELVKERAYGEGPAARSARAALAVALGVQLRLFAPFLPYVTEEIWSWFRTGSVHRSSWPETGELAADGDAAVLTATANALGGVRRAKSGRSLSMRAEVARVVVSAPPAVLAHLAAAESDLRAAGRIAKLDLTEAAGDLTVACEF
jgi:valyl-tRNA synthetase